MGKKLSDGHLLIALRQAADYYNRVNNMDRRDRYSGVVELAEWDLFSIAQLAQLSGFSTATLYGWQLNRGSGSGSFNPRSLDTMRLVLLDRIAGKRPNHLLIKALVMDGNSHRTIYKFTGVQPSTVSRIMKRAADG